MSVGKSSLRAVKPGEKPTVRSRRLSLTEAARSGSQRDLLVAMRDHLAQAISAGCAPRDLAALTKRLQDIVKDIEAIDVRAAAEVRGGAAVDDSFDASVI